MIQSQTQTQAYWVSQFDLTESDIEQLYNHFLEAERPQTAEQLALVTIEHRVAQEKNEIKQRLAGRAVYQPNASYDEGDELVFPALNFSYGTVTAVRQGSNPEAGEFKVIQVELDGKKREFASELEMEHVLNQANGSIFEVLEMSSAEDLNEQYGDVVAEKIEESLQEREDAVRLGEHWFLKGLLTEVNVGHLNLAEAVLEVNEGGPLSPEDILPHLELGDDAPLETQVFSLNYAMLQDNRFDEVAPRGSVGWYLQRLEPKQVREAPERLLYEPIPYDESALTHELKLLIRELDDEWSDVEPITRQQPAVLSLTYPHRWAGTLPLSARTRPLFPASRSERQRIVFVDEQSGDEIVGWVVRKRRYVYGLEEWYGEHEIPIGGFISLRPGEEPGVVLLDYDRRRGQREWVRLATVEDNRIQFELERRTISCGYDDQLIVGTDYIAAVDAAWRRAESQDRSVASLLRELFPELADLNPQRTVHAKTLYSAINMLRRMPPEPVFAELVSNPVFVPMGDHYWQYDSSKG
ncbi:MAG TPA: hypothetical protein VK879_06740 [Candidatus Sulfomarinibacteraceae bacterium]|nr:hypothetical protein [Candidatus Sulfomarinibacteraceae bacterium]